jgi:arylsulfatase A-like enzyme
MTIIKILQRVLFVYCGLLVVTSAQSADEGKKKPNVITIIIDDAGWKDVSYQGGEIATPEIDRMAENSIRFSQFYTYSTCTPTRAALLTGRAPSRSGIVYPIQHDDNYGIPADAETLAEVFQHNGYTTALIGKWHLGVQKEFSPNAHGFDYQYGMLGGWFDQYTRINPKTGYDWSVDGEIIEGEIGHTTDLLTGNAVRYIEDSGERPFFMYLSYTAPHVPIQVDDNWVEPYKGKFDTETRVGYAGMMAHLDYSIGKVITALEKQGILENTLIVFLSDNGPSAPGKKWYIPADKFTINFFGNDGEYGAVGELRGWKSSPYEGGIRVPAFIYWKNKLESKEWKDPVIVQDLYPTIIGLAGLEIKGDYKIESRDIFNTDKDASFYWRTPVNVALRHGDWKLIIQNKSPYEEELKTELFNIEEDISESNDCSETHPDKLNELLEIMRLEFSLDPEIYINPNLLNK